MLQQITSKKLGFIEYNKNDIISFPNGLLGFEDFKQFLLIKNDGNNVFLFLQSIDEPKLTFILIDPKVAMPNYELCVEKENLGEMDEKHIWDFAIVTVPEDPKKMVMNLLGPVLIDIKNQIGKQTISQKSDYTTRHKIFIDDEQKLAI